MSQQFDLGPWQRSVTTASAEAQAAYDDGLNWTYAFNHEEAVVCFRRAVEADPGCAMAWWGIAYAGGPFYNRAWVRYSVPEIETVLPPCYEAACRALALADRATPVEQALIRAVGRRYQSPETRDHATLNRWQDDYTQAMREAHAAWPDDLDVAALFAEAAITRTPRQLWDLRTGAPKPGADTEEALAVLERALATIEATGTPHPGILHMHIHLMEMSRTPERALRAFEQFVSARSARQADQRADRLERENLVLKRAVAVQARRLEATDGEKAALERTVSAQAERLRRAERTNYALSVHLHRASPGGMPDNRPPDVY